MKGRDPRFALVTVPILAVAIGACTAMFSIVHAVLLRPMAVPNAARVVMLWSVDVRHDTVGEATYEAETDYRAGLRSFDGIALMNSVNWNGALIIPGREPVTLSAAVSHVRIVVTPLLDFIFGPARRTLWLLMAGVVLVLLIACGNVAGLMFARGVSRRRELAIRAALGASRATLVRQLLAESALTAGAGGVVGLAAAAAALHTLIALRPADIPRLDAAGVDLPVALFAITTALIVTALVGVAPALRASRTSLVDDMKNGTMGAGQASAPGRGLLVAVQVGGTLLLLIATGLCLRSFARLSSLVLGFNPAQVLTFSVSGLDEEQFLSRPARQDVVERVIATIERLPEVRAAGAIFQRPFEHGPIGMDSSVRLEGQPDTPDVIDRNGVLNWESVTPRYFESMNIRLLRGRLFDARDRIDTDLSAIVSEATAHRFWPGQDPLGKRLHLSFADDARRSTGGDPRS